MEGHGLCLFVVVIVLVGVSVGLQIPGGWTDESVENTGVKNAAKFATKELSSGFSSIYHHKLVKIHKARTQVVSGVNYEVLIEIATTTCKKNEVPLEDVENCEIAVNEEKHLCKATVWVQRMGSTY
ncbi:L-cystatin-like [Limulus polyphemus]|uniref:L-cystatin-like n=1 Tax=Limulus polyphemus TaxID=6850 RepID=A0ABM1B8N3_LIMPO|nr:L-cystatin-like [Limulus polyphemus]